MSELVLKVEGMSCGHCVNSVETAVKEAGAQAQVDLANKKVTVQYDPSTVTTEHIIEAIEEQGYDVIK